MSCRKKILENYHVKRTTWGQNIAKSANYLYSGATVQDCEAFVLRDQIRMMDIGWSFDGMQGFRDIHGFKDFAIYEIEG